MRGIKLGSAFGIPVELNWTFLLVLPLFAIVIGLDINQLAMLLDEILGGGIDPDALGGGYRPWLLGFLAASGLFVGALLHEFGHSLIAMRYGYEIDSITLWLLGGLVTFAEVPENWRHEFWIAVAGPVVSVGVGIVSYGLFLVMPAGFDAGLFVFGYLAILNVALAMFNMLPAFPMDGGRVLRALLARNQPHAQATQLAAQIGKVFAVLLGILGLFANPILILLAVFIYIAASSEAKQTSIKAAFEDVTVGDVMTPHEHLHVVSPDTTIAELTERMFRERHTGYPVVEGEELVGLVTLDDAREVREIEREAYEVVDVMTRDLATVTPKTNAMEALRRIQQHDVDRLPVVHNSDAIVGIVSRTDLMTAFDIIQSTGPPHDVYRPDRQPVVAPAQPRTVTVRGFRLAREITTLSPTIPVRRASHLSDLTGLGKRLAVNYHEEVNFRIQHDASDKYCIFFPLVCYLVPLYSSPRDFDGQGRGDG